MPDNQKTTYQEQYTQLRVIGPQAWIFIAAILVGGSAALIWAIFGSIRESVTVNSVVTFPKGLLSVYSPNTERLKEIFVKPGDIVETGTLLARLEDSSQQEKLEKDKKLLDQALEINEKLLSYNQRLQQEAISKTEELNSIYSPLKKNAQDLFSKNLITSGNLANAEKDFFNNISTLNQQIEQLKKAERDINEDTISKQLDYEANLLNVKEKYFITSPYGGKIMDVNYDIGQYPNSDTPIITIKNLNSKRLIVMAAASSGDADRINKGYRVLFTPSNVERNRYGGIYGEVVSVSREPVSPENIINFVGNKQIGEKLATSESLYKIMIQLKKNKQDSNKYIWSSGSGPDRKNNIYPNLLGKSTIYYEERRPITYVLPFLRSLVGLQDNPTGE